MEEQKLRDKLLLSIAGSLQALLTNYAVTNSDIDAEGGMELELAAGGLAEDIQNLARCLEGKL